MSTCTLCRWPIEAHDRDISFRLPDILADCPEEELEARTSQFGGFLCVDTDQFFMRVLFPIHLIDDHVLVFGVWLSIDPATIQRVAAVWDTPEYASLEVTGRLASALPPWPDTSLGAVLTAQTRLVSELPYVTSSDDALMKRAISESWDHNTILEPLSPEIRGDIS